MIMYIPKKINLPYKNGKLIGLVKTDCGMPFKNADGNIEYIHKDTLLEWIVDELVDIRLHNNSFAIGRENELSRLKEKLYSL